MSSSVANSIWRESPGPQIASSGFDWIAERDRSGIAIVTCHAHFVPMFRSRTFGVPYFGKGSSSSDHVTLPRLSMRDARHSACDAISKLTVAMTIGTQFSGQFTPLSLSILPRSLSLAWGGCGSAPQLALRRSPNPGSSATSLRQQAAGGPGSPIGGRP